jgi:hypothetical protein
MNVFSQVKGVRWLRALATGVAGAYLVIGLILYFQQDFLLFPAPKSYAGPHLPTSILPLTIFRLQ